MNINFAHPSTSRISVIRNGHSITWSIGISYEHSPD